MQKPLGGTPTFDPADFRQKTRRWPGASDTATGQRIVVEWSVMHGPDCFVYPAGDRGAGFNLLDHMAPAGSDERWADYLDFEYVPQIVNALENDGYRPQVICVDLRPLQVQRARRRAIDAAAKAKSGGVFDTHLKPDHSGDRADRRGGAGI